MRKEFQLFVNEDGSIEILDPLDREKECYADSLSGVAQDVVEMLQEAGMIE